MRICLLSRNPTLYAGRRLVAAMRARGHGVLAIDYQRCSILLDGTATVHYAGNAVEVDAVLARVASGPEAVHGAAIVRQFEAAGVPCTSSSDAIARTGDKPRALQTLATAGIRVPRTAFGHVESDADLLLDSVGGPPVVLKLAFGSQGEGVILARTKVEAEGAIHAFQRMRAVVMVQEYVAEAMGADIRAFVVAGRIVAAMQRTAAVGEFRSNLHRGGAAKATTLTRPERVVALASAEALGLAIAGVDFVRTRDGPLVLEANASPGFEGLEKATRAAVAETIVRHVEGMARAHRRAR